MGAGGGGEIILELFKQALDHFTKLGQDEVLFQHRKGRQRIVTSLDSERGKKKGGGEEGCTSPSSRRLYLRQLLNRGLWETVLCRSTLHDNESEQQQQQQQQQQRNNTMK